MSTTKSKSRAASARARAKAKAAGTTETTETATKPKRAAAKKAAGKKATAPKRAAAKKAAGKKATAPKRAAAKKAAGKAPKPTRGMDPNAKATGVAAAPAEKRTSKSGYLSKYPYPARMTMNLPKSLKVPTTPVEHVQHAARAILLSSGEGFIRRGQLQLYLFTVANVTKSTEEARQMVAEAFDAGVLRRYSAE